MAESIGFPLPVVVKGYPCMTGGDVELARKGIDPARPQQEPEAAAAQASAREGIDPQRIAAARVQASEQSAQVTGYGPSSVRTAAVAVGTLFSTQA